MYFQRTPHYEQLEYLVSLIADCHKQKYSILYANQNLQGALTELKQAVRIAKESLTDSKHPIVNDLQRLIHKHKLEQH